MMNALIVSTNQHKSGLVLLLTLTLITASTDAARWTGVTDTNWMDPNNWDTGTVPDGTEPILISGGSPVVPDGFEFSDLTVSSGTVTGDFVITGDFEWTGGTLKDGTTTIAAGATLRLAGTGTKTLDQHVLVNEGIIDWSGNGLVNGNNGSEVRNAPPGLLHVHTPGNTLLRTFSGDPLHFINLGSLRKTGGDVLFEIRAHVEHRGVMEVEAGELQMESGGVLAGSMVAAAFAAISLTSGDFVGEGILEVANFTLAGGSLGGTNVLQGNSFWASGTLKRGSTVIPEGSTLTLTGTGTKTMETAALTNTGTVVWAGSGLLNANDASTLANEAPGTFEITAPAVSLIRSLSGTPAIFYNAGRFTKTGGGDHFEVRVGFRNTGTVQVDSGELRFTSGGSVGGEWVGASGTAPLLSNGTFDLDGTIVSQGLVFGGGEFVGTGSLDGVAVWAGGIFSRGETLIEGESTLLVEGTSAKGIDDHVLRNAGTITWLGTGIFSANNGSTIVNEPEGLISFNVDGTHVLRTDTGTTGNFDNQGTLTKTGPADAITEIRMNFNNSEVVRVISGTLRFSTRFVQTAGQTVLLGGTIRTTGGLNLEGGSLSGVGTVEGDVVNGAMVSPGGTEVGLLSITGDYTQNAAGTLHVNISGLNPVTEHDLMEVTGRAFLGGKIIPTFTGGFLPLIGNEFEVLTYRNVTGTAELNDITLALEPTYEPERLILVTVREPEVVQPFSLTLLPVSESEYQIILTGTAGQNYAIEASTDLVNWSELLVTNAPTDTLEFIDVPPGNFTRRFYRAEIVP